MAKINNYLAIPWGWGFGPPVPPLDPPMGCTTCAAKTKKLISCAVTAQLICVFVFAYANCWFSDAETTARKRVLKLCICMLILHYSDVSLIKNIHD